MTVKTKKGKKVTSGVVDSVVAGSAGVSALPLTNALRRSYYKRQSGKKLTKKQEKRLRKAEKRLLKDLPIQGLVLDNAGTRLDGKPVGAFIDPAPLFDASKIKTGSLTVDDIEINSDRSMYLSGLDLERVAMIVSVKGEYVFVIREGDNVDSHRARIRREAKKVGAKVSTTVNRVAGQVHDQLVVTIS